MAWTVTSIPATQLCPLRPRHVRSTTQADRLTPRHWTDMVSAWARATSTHAHRSVDQRLYLLADDTTAKGNVVTLEHHTR